MFDHLLSDTRMTVFYLQKNISERLMETESFTTSIRCLECQEKDLLIEKYEKLVALLKKRILKVRKNSA